MASVEVSIFLMVVGYIVWIPSKPNAVSGHQFNGTLVINLTWDGDEFSVSHQLHADEGLTGLLHEALPYYPRELGPLLRTTRLGNVRHSGSERYERPGNKPTVLLVRHIRAAAADAKEANADAKGAEAEEPDDDDAPGAQENATREEDESEEAKLKNVTEVKKKAITTAGSTYERHGPGCLAHHLGLLYDEQPVAGKMSRHMVVHQALLVPEFEELQLTCHYCEKTGEATSAAEIQKQKEKARMKRSRLWFKIDQFKTRMRGKRRYKVDEVKIDLYNDPNKNRVFVTDKHTLVIRNVTLTDAGTYMCKDMTVKDKFFKRHMATRHIVKMFQADNMLRFLFHVEVVSKAAPWAFRIVTTNKKLRNSKRVMAKKDKNIPSMNVKVFTIWQQWSQCSMCGFVATRRRLGICTAKKLNQRWGSKPWFLNILLDIYRNGLPCRSNIFRDIRRLSKYVWRPVDEVEEGYCEVSCKNYTLNLKLLLDREASKLRTKVFVLDEGERVKMKCPRARKHMPVHWINGTTVLLNPYLKALTNGRARVNRKHRLLISKVLMTDAGRYYCLVGLKITARVRLEVGPGPPKGLVGRYAFYILCSYPIDFGIFLVLMFIKFSQSRRVLNYDVLPEPDDMSGESASSVSDINVNRNRNAVVVYAKDRENTGASFPGQFLTEGYIKDVVTSDVYSSGELPAAEQQLVEIDLS